MTDVVMVICAHNDDHILGVGGTIAKYAKEGSYVVVVVLSYGESSHAWLKEKEVIKTRVKESKSADKTLNISRTYYYGLKEGHFYEEFESRNLKRNLKRKISVLKPSKIFTHSPDDPHPDHRATYYKVMETLEKARTCDVYSFDVWNPLKLKKRNSPMMFVDVTNTFKQKTKAFTLHKSQWHARMLMMPVIYTRAILNGLEHGVRYAEVFYKLK